jgi:diguanylate cyclase (GGDEF)-like protein
VRLTGRVGVLSPFVGGDYYGAVIAGVNQAATAAGGQVIAIQTLDPGAQSADYCGVPDFGRQIAWRHFDAAVVLPGAVDAAYVSALRRGGKPVVLVSYELAGVDCPTVSADCRSGVREAMGHLVGHGHRRIAFAGNLAISDVRERHQGYLEAIAAHGLAADPELLFVAPDNHESGGIIVARALIDAGAKAATDAGENVRCPSRGGLPATAIMMGTDRNAIGLVQTLLAAGHRLPDELAVIGFDDIAEARYLLPSLSSVHQPLDRLGALAYDTAQALAAGTPAPAGPLPVPTRFVRRDSCGCPTTGLHVSESEARRQFTDNTYLQMTLNIQYELGVELLRTHERDPRAMAWLGRTPASGGSLGLWPGPPSDDDPDPLIDIVGAFRADAGPSSPSRPALPVGSMISVGSTMPVSHFPPVGLVESADGPAGQIVFVVPVRSEARDWGVFAAVGLIQDSTPPGREMMNHSGSLLAVALDHDTVLRSLHERQEQLRRAALYDQLTGLPNRTLLLDRIRQAGHHAARRPDGCFAVLFLDLNGFKTVNDTLGHAAGDQVLVHVAQRLSGALRGSDTAARLGGDEFVVLLDGLASPDEAGIAMERIHAALAEQLVVEGRPLRVRASIGVAHSGTGAVDPDALLRQADASMYLSKVDARRRSAPDAAEPAALGEPEPPFVAY